MIAVVQRVTEAAVRVEGETVASIARGLVALVAVCGDDSSADVQWMARKLVGLRIFRTADKQFDGDVKQAGGAILLVSNFTVAAATRHGRRPSFDAAAGADQAAKLFSFIVEQIKFTNIPTEAGRFGADMQVQLTNDGPVTVILDSSEAR